MLVDSSISPEISAISRKACPAIQPDNRAVRGGFTAPQPRHQARVLEPVLLATGEEKYVDTTVHLYFACYLQAEGVAGASSPRRGSE